MKRVNRFLAVLLTVLMIVNVLPIGVLAADTAGSDSVVVIAGSDFQDPDDGNDPEAADSSANVSAILTQINEDYPEADGLIFCGDYDYDINAQILNTRINVLKSTFESVFGSGKDEFFVQGNHDEVAQGTKGLTGPGAHDTDDYGVFIIDEDDYQGYASGKARVKEARVRETAANLKSYLDAKAAANYSKPIFVASHVPLHFSARTSEGDNLYAKYIFDELQAGGEAGLTIIFLYGHDHSQGFDNYLGGAAVYLPEGHDINIAVPGSASNYNTYQLGFTYMNAGFVGYYADTYADEDSGTGSGVDKTLTMTVFEITDGQVKIARYDADGVHNLKSEGKPCVLHQDTTPVMTDVLASPQYVYTDGTIGGDNEIPAESNILADNGSGVIVNTPSGTALTVAPLSSTETYDGITKYVLYDIDIEGFQTGDTATVSIPVPEGYDDSKLGVYHVDDTNSLTEMEIVSVGNGMVSFRTTHFSTYMVGEEEVVIGDWIALSSIPGRYKLDTDGIDYGTDNTYIIVASGSNYLMKKDTGRVAVSFSDDGTFSDARNGDKFSGADVKANEAVWTFNEAGKILSSDGKYLRKDNDKTNKYELKVDDKTNYSDWTIVHVGGGQYQISMVMSDIPFYLYDAGNGFKLSTSEETVRLYKLTPYYVGLSSDESYTFYTSRFANQAALESYLKNCVKLYSADDDTGTNIEQVEYTLSGTVDPTVAGNGSLKVNYQGQEIGTISLTFQNRSLNTIELNGNDGVIVAGTKKMNAESRIIATYDDGSTEQVPITLKMLSGDFDANAEGEYTNLTVTYNGKTVSGYTLRVIPNPYLNDYPEYPNEGSVIVDKHGAGIDFQSTGVAEIELSAKGIPTNNGVDVIVMIDTSSSMTRGVTNDYVNAPNRRIDFLKNSLKDMLETFSTPNEDGTAPDIKLALADFNGMLTEVGEDEWEWEIDNMYDVSLKFLDGSWPNNYTNVAQVYSGSKEISAGAFEQVGEYTDADINALVDPITTGQGTNYDYAFDTIYRLATAIQAENEANGEERELAVIFMSDGAPYAYNYYAANNDVSKWNNYLNGTLSDADFDKLGDNEHFYNAETNNTHRMADAIKGDPNETFEVISGKSDLIGATPVEGKDNMYTVYGLGATMYSIGYCIMEDGSVAEDTVRNTISRIASSEDYYFEASSGADTDMQAKLNAAFANITSSIRKAGTNARFIDTMGKDYDIQLASKEYKVLEDGTEVTREITPSITVKAYDVHKRAEYEDSMITEDQIGTRTSAAPEVLETVTFNADGTEAYSDKLGTDNILINGVIRAKTFYYNTNSTAVTINGITIEPENFYWIIGDILEREYTLSYYVYLTGSMEGTRPAGYYPTNESAVLHYTNWLGHEAHKDTVSPILPWGAAQVSYAFYLVDDEGNVVNSMGDKSSFAYRVALTQPAIYTTLYLNSGTDIGAEFTASEVVPAGFDLYDPDAAYKIEIASNGIDSGWEITKGTDKNTTTYVTNFNGNAFSSELNEDTIGYDYTNTIVWFAVKTQIKCVPDIVVIDFGLPVDINVLANDMLGNYGKLTAIVNADDVTDMNNGSSPRHAEPVTSASLGLKFGVSELNADDGNMVTYTPTTMSMYDIETYAYEVEYNNPAAPGVNGYYYATITVVPATLIYYEDRNNAAEFATFRGNWVSVGFIDNLNHGQLKKQAQDRPGFLSFSSVDANNIYGYDAAYGDCTQFSLDSAKKVTVSNKDKGSWPTATFTFTGTGFDLISVTDKDTGLIKVDVYKIGEITTDSNGKPVITRTAQETLVKSWAVDTYYGYKSVAENGYYKSTWTYDGSKWHVEREEVAEKGENDSFPAKAKANDVVVTYDVNYKWTVTDSNDSNALYQIPVIKCYNTLDYAQYKVVITPTYSTIFQHNSSKDSYDYYFDAVRIYNPADESDDALGYYKQDNEAYPEYIEIRENLISQDAFSSFGEDENAPIAGAVFIDAYEDGSNVSKYTEFGPNNEVYLNPGQSIAFKVTTSDKDNLASVQIGAKSVDGPAALRIRSYQEDETEGFKMVADNTRAINTATDMFYDVSFYVTWETDTLSNTIVLTNDGNAILSLTQMKFTFKEDPNPPVSQSPVRMLMAPRTAMLLTSTLTNDYIAAHTEEELPVEIFIPEKLELSLKKDSVKKGQKVDATVVSSADVDAVTINGIAAKLSKTNKKTGEKTWTLTLTAETSGTMVISAVGTDSNGIDSIPVEATVTVKK